MRSKSTWRALIAVLSVALALAGCAARERQRPVRTTRISQGAESMEAVRKALEGRWILVSLNVATVDGRRAPVDATGVLLSDAFGALGIEYRMSEAGRKALEALGIAAPNPVISTAGRVVIDPQQQRITYIAGDASQQALGFDPDLAARRANPFTLERARYYAFGEDGSLTLSTRHDNGTDAAISLWKKGPEPTDCDCIGHARYRRTFRAFVSRKIAHTLR
jgi:hypothetical protein